MPTSRNNDIRIQFVADSRIIHIIKEHFDQNDIPVNSVSDLVRKALQTFALNVLRPTQIPSKEIAQESISELAQHGRGFGRDYNTLKSKNSLKVHSTQIPKQLIPNDDEEAELREFASRFPHIPQKQLLENLRASKTIQIENNGKE